MSALPQRGVLVTGAAGFIGGEILRGFAARGWRAIGCGRRASSSINLPWRWYDLTSSSLSDALFEDVDVVVHAAYAKGDYDVNVTGSLLLLDRALRSGVRRVVFLSSLAAHPQALSAYGKQKYDLQQGFAARDALVVRPGLVIGAGGTFGATCAYLRSHRFVPLIDGGVQPLQTVYVNDLVDALCSATERGDTGIYTVAERVPVKYRTFYDELARTMRRRIVYLPLPFWTADVAVKTAGAIGIALPIDRDNLLGLRMMQLDAGPWLDPPGRTVGDFRANLARAAAAGVFARLA